MKKILLRAFFISLAVAISCSFILDFYRETEAQPPQSDEYRPTQGIMVVISYQSTQQVLMHFAYDPDKPVEIINNTLKVDGVTKVNDLTGLNVDYYKMQKIPMAYDDEGNPRSWYLWELNLVPIDSGDLPHSQHIGKLTAVDPTKARPATVTRKFQGMTFDVQCLVTQSVVDMYLAGTIGVGDFVIVSFIDEMPDETALNIAIVTDKVYKTW